MIDWDDPSARCHLIERVGPEEYNRLFAEHRKQSVLATVNGHDIYPVNSGRFGRIYMVSRTDTGFDTLAKAKAFAKKTPN